MVLDGSYFSYILSIGDGIAELLRSAITEFISAGLEDLQICDLKPSALSSLCTSEELRSGIGMAGRDHKGGSKIVKG